MTNIDELLGPSKAERILSTPTKAEYYLHSAREHRPSLYEAIFGTPRKLKSSTKMTKKVIVKYTKKEYYP